MATANLLQTSVSGGTQNALSLQGDGVFFPKASTTSRLALTLTTTDKGFIVYDTTDNNIYFWNGAAWESIPGSGDAGANGSVQYNDNGIVSGASNFIYDKATSAVSVAGDLTVDTSTLKVDSTNDRVGFGTASPAQFVHLSKSNTSTALTSPPVGNASFRIQNTSSTNNNFGSVEFYNAAGLFGASVNCQYTNQATPTNDLVFVTRGSSGGLEHYRIAADGVATWSEVGGIAGTAMTLNATGLLVGTTTNTNSSRVFARGTGGATTLAIQSSTGDTANPGLLVGKFDNDSTTSQILVRFTINNNTVGSGQITANGANAAAFGTFSDSRLKENILSLPSQLANILSLRPVEFDYKDGSGHQIGFVAQEMQGVYSDAVGEQNGFLTVTGWSKTEARLVSAIKELAAKVQALEAKLA